MTTASLSNRIPFAGFLKWVIPIVACLTIALNWSAGPSLSSLQRTVDPLFQVDVLESKWLYMWVLLFTVSFPIVFGFLPRLRFDKVWPQVMLANIPVTLAFIAWDVYFTNIGAWGFSADYTTGYRVLRLPWEEWMFFILIPFACTFIYWSVSRLLQEDWLASAERMISYGLIFLFFLIGIFAWDQLYTATSALACGFFLLYHVLFIRQSYRGRFYFAFLLSCIPFFVVNGILTGMATESPVVMYSPQAFSGIRIITIPAEDLMYSFLLLLGNITLFEALRHRQSLSR